VRPLVRLEVRGLGVDFLAAAELALVDSALAAIQGIEAGTGFLGRGPPRLRGPFGVLGSAAIAPIGEATGAALHVLDELDRRGQQREPVPRVRVQALEGLGLLLQVPLHLQNCLQILETCFVYTFSN